MAGTTLVTREGDGVGLGTALGTLAREKDQPGKMGTMGMEAGVPSWGCRLDLSNAVGHWVPLGVGGWE